MGKKMHLINEVGHRIEVESCALADDELLNENKYSNHSTFLYTISINFIRCVNKYIIPILFLDFYFFHIRNAIGILYFCNPNINN